MNLLPTSYEGDSVVFGSAKVPVDARVAEQLSKVGPGQLTVGLRPQALTPAAEGVPAQVVVVEELGSETFVFVELEHLGQTVRVRVRVDADFRVARGDQLFLKVLGPVHVFGPDGLRLMTSDETGD